MALGNKTLDDLLGPISLQLGRTSAPYRVEQPEWQSTPARPTDGLDNDGLVDLFAAEAGKIRVGVHRCAAGQVAQEVAAIIDEQGGGGIVAADDERLREWGVYDAVERGGQVGALTVWDGANAQACVDAANVAQFGITVADCAIAETGTVVQSASARCGRSVSLLPLVHIAIVEAGSIVPTMAEVMAKFGGGEDLPSQLCFISGPSATSDIELVRVEGVHGPMYVHYVIVE